MKRNIKNRVCCSQYIVRTNGIAKVVRGRQMDIAHTYVSERVKQINTVTDVNKKRIFSIIQLGFKTVSNGISIGKGYNQSF